MKIHGEKAQMEMFSVHVEATRIILDWQSRNLNLKTKLVVALSSQMFTANANLTWIDESTALSPSTKYGQTKSRAYELIREYRSKYGVYATGAILFNHSSRFSKPDFVLVEIARQIIEVRSGESNRIVLRNFDSEMDISDAESICMALVRMLSLEKPEDFVLASGTPTNLRKLTLDCLEWYRVTRKIELISTNPIRTHPKTLVGNSKKASSMLNWNPTHDPVTLLISIVDNLVELALND
jgi:GDPmannose 4,6-dehydratase